MLSIHNYLSNVVDLEHLTIVALSGSSVTEKTVRHGLLTLPKLKTLLVFGLKVILAWFVQLLHYLTSF